MHGYERGRKDLGVDHHELHVGLYAIKREDEGRILESREQAMTAQASEIMIYDRMKHEAASTHLVPFWNFRVNIPGIDGAYSPCPPCQDQVLV